MKIIIITFLVIFTTYVNAKIPLTMQGRWNGVATYDQSGEVNFYNYTLLVKDNKFISSIGGGDAIYRSNLKFDKLNPKKFKNRVFAWDGTKFFGDGSGYCLLNRCSLTAVRLDSKTSQVKYTYTDNFIQVDHNTLQLFGHHIDSKGVIFDSWSVILTRVWNGDEENL